MANTLVGFLTRSRQLLHYTIAAVTALLLGAACVSAESKERLCNEVPKALAIASKIRGLKPKGPVSCRVQNKDEVRKFILDQVNTKIPSERLRLEEAIYKTIGFIPEDFDYKDGLIDLYSEQIGGYYDPDSKQFTMASWMPLESQLTVAVHELTHALQDQYFNLKQFQDYSKLTSDEQLAASALIEGDATAVMLDEKMPPPGIRAMSNVDPIVAAQAMAAALMVQGTKPVPDSLKMLIIFPYSEGLRLAHALLRSGGYIKIDGAFSQMPKTTKEILSPINYINGFEPVVLSETAACSQEPKDCAIIHTDSLGEFMLRTTLISNKIPSIKAQRLASAWNGDKLEVVKKGGAEMLIWRLSFNTPTAATAFAGQLKEINYKMSISLADSLVTLQAPLVQSTKNSVPAKN
jgi:hypothetical protein